jgi:Phage minor structural protein GP20
MSDTDPSKGEGGPAGGDNPADPKPGTGEGGDPKDGERDEFDGKSAEEIRALLKQKDSEAAKWRRQAEEKDKSLKKIEEERLSEEEKLKRRVAEYEQKEQDWEKERKETRIRDAVLESARAAGSPKPEGIYRLIDTSGIDVGDDGTTVTGVDAAIGKAKTDYPELFRAAAGNVNGAARGQGTKGGDEVGIGPARLRAYHASKSAS